MIRKTVDTIAMKRNISVTVMPLLIAYGATPKLALFGVLPYIEKRLHLNVAGMRLRRQSRGLGDAKLFTRYTVYQLDKRGDTSASFRRNSKASGFTARDITRK